MSNAHLSFCLLVPTLNEIEGMRAVMPHVDRSLFSQIIVIDGGSTDGTLDYAREQGYTVMVQPKKGLPDAEDHAF
jgi:glycosyltransferase involved in cell wall biosynthesis